MHHALSRHADEIFEALPSEAHRTAATRLFKALTERGPDGRGIRRPTRLGALAAIVGSDAAIVRLVIEAYRAPGVTFLMPPVTSPLDDSSVIDISHESLMRTWTRLRLWVEEEAQSARIYRRLLETAALHSEKRAGLYHDPDLQVALSWRDTSEPNAAWAEQYGGGFEGAMAFLDQSREVAEREEKEREAARQRELERAQQFAAAQAKVARVFKRFAGSLAIVLCFAVALTIWAFKLRQEAQAKKKEAEAQRSIAQRTAYDASISSIQADWEKRNYRRVRDTLASQADYAEPSFEWFYWQRMTHLELSWFGTYADGIRSYSVSADGKKIVLVMHDHSIEVRSLPAGEVGARFLATGENAAFSPDGRMIVTSGGDYKRGGFENNGEIKLWNAETGVEIKSAFGQFDDTDNSEILPDQTVGGYQRAAAFSSDGRLLVTGGFPSSGVQLWEVATGKKLRVFEDSQTIPHWMGQWIEHLAFSPDGKRVLCERGESLELYDVATGKKLDSLAAPGEGGLGFALSSDSRRVAAAWGGKITIYDLTAPGFSKVLLEIRQQPGEGNALAFSPDGKRLVASNRWSSGGGDSAIYDSFTGEKQLTLRGGSHASQFLGDSQQIISTDGERHIKIWDASTDPELVRVKTGYIPIALARDGSRMVVCLPDEGTSGKPKDEDRHTGRLGVVDTATGKLISQMVEHEGGLIDGAAISPDLNWVASGGRDEGGTIRVWNAVTGKVKLKVETPRAEHYEIGFGPKSDIIISRTEQPRGHAIWDIESGDEILTPKTPIDERDWAITRDGLHLASCDSPGYVRIWDTRTGAEIRKWKAHAIPDNGAMIAHSNECMDYSTDGKHLVTGGMDRLIKLWNPETGQLERVFSGHLGFLVGVHFTPDQRRLISQSVDRTVRIWDVATGKELLSMTDPLFDGVYTWCVGVSRDGRRVISAPCRQREILIWDAATPEQVAAWRQHEEADATLWAAEQAKRQ
jgi:WD40 repeat protein